MYFRRRLYSATDMKQLQLILLSFLIYFGGCSADRQPCKSNLDCTGPTFCKTYTGMCNGPYGFCTPTTIHCLEGTEVCGCDGKNYASECEAAKVNVSIMYQGNCLQDNHCKSNSDCGGKQRYCDYQNNCNSYGICKGLPKYCPLEVGIVCGCNDKNYVNECHAAANGTSVMLIQPCKLGYCTTNADCGAGSTCLMPPGICNGDASQGVCVLQPPNCSQVYEPVCGCDERIYPNSCIAIQNGVSINAFQSCSRK